jgi:hypothetical protein
VHGQQQLAQFLNGRGKVGVGEQTEAPLRRQHTLPHRIAFAPIGRMAQHPQIRQASDKTFRQLTRPIRAAVVHDDDLHIVCAHLPSASKFIVLQVIVQPRQSAG